MKHHLDSVDGEVEPIRCQRLSIFKQWFKEHQVILENVDIRSSSLGKGFALCSTSSEASPRIEIPRSLLMTMQSARESPSFTLPSADIHDQTDDHIDRETLTLALFLLHERNKGDQSHWYPYIQLLSEHFSTPLFHKENYLENTPVFHLTQTMHHSMSEVFALVDSKSFSLEDFLWAYTILTSRAFKIKDIGTALILLGDLANHVSFLPEANLRTMGIDPMTDRFILTTNGTTISHGDELCITYNTLSNWELILHYGFAIENNPFDSIILELKINSDDTYKMEMKKVLLFNLNEDLSFEHELKLTNDDQSIISDELMASLRLLVMSVEELENYDVSNIDELLSSMVNNDNERRALNKLQTLLNDLQEASFTTTLDENLKRFQAEDLTDDERYSLIYLIGQKKIIHQASQWINDALSQLESE